MYVVAGNARGTDDRSIAGLYTCVSDDLKGAYKKREGSDAESSAVSGSSGSSAERS